MRTLMAAADRAPPPPQAALVAAVASAAGHAMLRGVAVDFRLRTTCGLVIAALAVALVLPEWLTPLARVAGGEPLEAWLTSARAGPGVGAAGAAPPGAGG